MISMLLLQLHLHLFSDVFTPCGLFREGLGEVDNVRENLKVMDVLKDMQELHLVVLDRFLSIFSVKISPDFTNFFKTKKIIQKFFKVYFGFLFSFILN